MFGRNSVVVEYLSLKTLKTRKNKKRTKLIYEMAKRGAALPDIRTDEDLDELLKTQCLHVLNVYSGFFGPCNAMAANLRDYKMIHAGDDLRVTTVNVDEIEVFKRFRNKSEPAYLIVLNGCVINSYYGCNTSALLDVIKDELVLYKSAETIERQTFDLREMSALEAQRFRFMREKLIADRKRDQAKKQQIVHDYKISVTDNIMENAADIGVTLFMPHVIDDELLANLSEPAGRMHMQQKTTIVTQITKEDMEMINFDNDNMSPLLFNHIRDRDILIVAWKMASGELRPINEVFSEFARSLRVELEFEKRNTKSNKQKNKPKPKKKKEVEEIKEEKATPLFKLSALPVSIDDLQKPKADPIQIEPVDLQFIESEKDVIKLVSESITAFTEKNIVELHNDCIRKTLIELIDGTKTEEIENVKKDKVKGAKTSAKSKSRGDIIYDPKDKKTAYICPVWTPPTQRSHASFLYLYFRRLLSFFLPLDPPGASKFVIVVFSATKHEEILEFLNENRNLKANVLAHGFFRGFIDGEDFSNTKLICKTGIEYRMGIRELHDKLILKVCSSTEALLALVDFDPVFVSQNELDAQQQADVIFPLGYVSISEEEAAAELKMDEMFGGTVEGKGETEDGQSTENAKHLEAINVDVENATN